MRLDLLLVYQPTEHRTGAVSRITDQALGLEVKAFLDPIDHRPGGIVLFRAVSRRRLDVNAEV
jgi:hypothetical protein